MAKDSVVSLHLHLCGILVTQLASTEVVRHRRGEVQTTILVSGLNIILKISFLYQKKKDSQSLHMQDVLHCYAIPCSLFVSKMSSVSCLRCLHRCLFKTSSHVKTHESEPPPPSVTSVMDLLPPSCVHHAIPLQHFEPKPTMIDRKTLEEVFNQNC